MKDWVEKRLVLITGKGGVGRSTLSAALAHAARRAGKRVLLAEVGDGGDDYSPLAQLFGVNQLPRKAGLIAPGIEGSQLLSDLGIELFLVSVLRSALLARTALGFEPLRRLFSAAPSLREMGTFFHLLTYLRAEKAPGVPLYEVIVVDMPATGHTLALTGLPDVVLRLITRGPIADGLREGQRYLHDPLKTGAYIVTLPETLPISEALELLQGLQQTRVPCSGFLVNRVPLDSFSAEEKEALRPLLARQPLFGADGFARIEQARRELGRLSNAALPVKELPELEETGALLIARLAEAL